MGLSKTRYKCSKCERVYDYHNHAVYVDTQSQTLVMKCPTDGAVAYWYDGEISSYEVEGAFDLMDVKVDNESKSVIFTMNRDETKQDRLSVKTDTPETVDISLKKDVLQVDVKNNGGGEKPNYKTHVLPVETLSYSDGAKVDERRFPYGKITINEYIGDEKPFSYYIHSLDIDLTILRTDFAYLDLEKDIQIGLFRHNNQFTYEQLYNIYRFNDENFDGFHQPATLYYEVIDYKQESNVIERKEYAYTMADISVFPDTEPLDDETIPMGITVRPDFLEHLFNIDSPNVMIRITGISTFIVIE